MNPIFQLLDESSISKRINTTSGLEKIAANKCTIVHLISKVQFKNINVQFTEIRHILDRSADLSSRQSLNIRQSLLTLLLNKVMAGVYKEETFKPFTQPLFIDLFLKMKKHTDSAISKLTDKIRNLNANFKRLESDVQVCKRVNDALVKQAVSLERQCWRNALCSRRESVEI